MASTCPSARPARPFDLGIGMIHQHFKLVDVLTAAENIVLGLPGGAALNRKELGAQDGRTGREVWL